MLRDSELIYWLACLVVADSLMAIVMWWRYPRLWAVCSGVLATAVVLVFFVPVRISLRTPEDDYFQVFLEIVGIGAFIGVIHLWFVLLLFFDRGDR